MEAAVFMTEQSFDVIINEDVIDEDDVDALVAKESVVNEVQEADKDEFDGWDSSWYWDNDFDCLSATDDGSSIEIIPAAYGGAEDKMEMESVVNDNNDGPPSKDGSCCPVSVVEVGNYDLLSNEDYLKKFEEKFHQTKDIVRSLSSISSSLSSSSDSSQHDMVKVDEICHFTPDQEDCCEPLKSSSTSMPLNSASIRTHDDGVAKRVLPGLTASGMTVPVDSFGQQVASPVVRNDAASLKTTKKRKKMHHRISATLKETDRMELVDNRNFEPGQGSHASPIKLTPVAVSGSGPKQLSVYKVIAVSGLSAVVGVFCGLLIRGLFADSRESLVVNLVNDEKPNCGNCLSSENDQRLILNSVWALKYEELIIENAELQLKLRYLDTQLTFDLCIARDSVMGMKNEFVRLNRAFTHLENLSVEEGIEGTGNPGYTSNPVHFLSLSTYGSCLESAEVVNWSNATCFNSTGDRHE